MFPAAKNIPLDELEEPEPLKVTIPNCGKCHVCIGGSWEAADPDIYIYEEDITIRQEIRDVRHANLTTPETVGKLGSGHDLLTKRRVAKHIAVLHGRTKVERWDWDIAGRLIDHSDNLRAYLHANLTAFVEADNEVDIIAHLLKSNQTKDHPVRSEMIYRSVSSRLYRRTSATGFTLTFLGKEILSGEEYKLLSAKGKAAGKPTSQIVGWLQHQDAIDWDGMDAGKTPRGKTIIWRKEPS